MAEQQDRSAAMGQELQDIVQHAEALLAATAGEMDARVREARERLEARLSEAKHKYQAAGESFKETVEATDRFVHEKPYHAIGGFFFAGLLLGWFMRGR